MGSGLDGWWMENGSQSKARKTKHNKLCSASLSKVAAHTVPTYLQRAGSLLGVGGWWCWVTMPGERCTVGLGFGIEGEGSLTHMFARLSIVYFCGEARCIRIATEQILRNEAGY